MKTILFDLDGVLYQGGSVLAGAVETLDWVRREGIDHQFLTNTSSRPRAAIHENLACIGIQVALEEILTPRWPPVIGFSNRVSHRSPCSPPRRPGGVRRTGRSKRRSTNGRRGSRRRGLG